MVLAGMQVHREVQPDSCVWCDSVSRWRLAGSGTWARKGTDAALSYNLRYAAPEVISAHRRKPCLHPNSCHHSAAVQKRRYYDGLHCWAEDACFDMLTSFTWLQVVMADSLGVAMRLKMSSHAASAAGDGPSHDSESQSDTPGGSASSAAAVTQGPVLHVTQVKP